MGNGRTLKPGEIQLMSAGTGVTHSEFNPSRNDGLHFLQIWIMPDERGLQPSYTEWKPTPAQAQQADVVVISPDGRDGSARIHQDVIVRRLRLPAGATTPHTIAAGRGVWLQLISGELQVGEHRLRPGDGLCSDDAGAFLDPCERGRRSAAVRPRSVPDALIEVAQPRRAAASSCGDPPVDATGAAQERV
jgi:redox-sensitive bicupin YhaK (pirin superfamily)